jgi:hypothetical protein
LLTSTEPAREDREEDLKRGNGNNHGGASLLHCRGSHGRWSGRVLGHYAERTTDQTLVVPNRVYRVGRPPRLLVHGG